MRALAYNVYSHATTSLFINCERVQPMLFADGLSSSCSVHRLCVRQYTNCCATVEMELNKCCNSSRRKTCMESAVEPSPSISYADIGAQQCVKTMMGWRSLLFSNASNFRFICVCVCAPFCIAAGDAFIYFCKFVRFDACTQSPLSEGWSNGCNSSAIIAAQIKRILFQSHSVRCAMIGVAADEPKTKTRAEHELSAVIVFCHQQ